MADQDQDKARKEQADREEAQRQAAQKQRQEAQRQGEQASGQRTAGRADPSGPRLDDNLEDARRRENMQALAERNQEKQRQQEEAQDALNEATEERMQPGEGPVFLGGREIMDTRNAAPRFGMSQAQADQLRQKAEENELNPNFRARGEDELGSGRRSVPQDNAQRAEVDARR